MSENTTQLSVPEMLRLTGDNTADFMKQVATHIEKLETTVSNLQIRITELESQNGNNSTTQ